MAKLISSKSLDGLIEDLDILAELTDDIIEDILDEQAEVVVQAQRREIKQQWSGPHSEGISAKCVKKGKVKDTKDGKVIYVYPSGTRGRGEKRVRNAEIAFMNEFGSSGKGRSKSHKKRTEPKKIPPRPAIQFATEKSRDAVVATGEKVLGEHLDKLKL